MKARELKKGIYWVGGIDWKLRVFHGYTTPNGTTYNAYLIIDDKVTLVDTVKYYLYEEMLTRIKSIIDPSKIDYIITNHVEMDHSGSLPYIMETAKNATVVISPNGEKSLCKHFPNDWKMQVVKTGDTLRLGKRTLQFILTPMIHWPDSMVCYDQEDKILFSNDSFGQHIGSSERFDDEMAFGSVMYEAAKYYANIVLTYGQQVQKYLQEAAPLAIDMIAPSHGLIWRSHIKDIVDQYTKWANNECTEKAVIIYETMWRSTEKMAYALRDMFEEQGISYSLRNLAIDHISEVMSDILTAKYICIGSPTLNNEMLPMVAGFLTYMKALAPKKRIGIAFGSYGWGGQSIRNIEDMLEVCQFTVPLKDLRIQYVPSKQELNEFINKVQNALFETTINV